MSSAYQSYEERYGVMTRAMRKRNWLRWICAWCCLTFIFILPLPYGLIVALSADTIVYFVNTRDINKTHKLIMEDIDRRYSASNLTQQKQAGNE